MKSKLSVLAAISVIVMSIQIQLAITRTRDFADSATISMPTRLAAQLKLIDGEDARWGGSNVAFRRAADGGYEYRQIGGISLFDSIKHTSLDIASECARARSCLFLTDGEFKPRQ
ncbi:hypothetical protein [Burkholderia cenocepacia]|uniref:hypothetical protein n=1 Tax=Burkholderia cenocepacia TaxID=95486 RepID=UPI0013DFE000|nr:hypothetical protein [Burkholderia cenocepacia]MCW3587432.1 hypothetical protein [Burkholderia cenocepacia]MCW3633872.1 hypothetical protein [Burkholderia cenocepacia]MCW5184774.1 hypothetical protein [Burkholderia cenocepacia]NGO98006.1 hypothetical protein [Burkholderia cenocepacia]